MNRRSLFQRCFAALACLVPFRANVAKAAAVAAFVPLAPEEWNVYWEAADTGDPEADIKRHRKWTESHPAFTSHPELRPVRCHVAFDFNTGVMICRPLEKTE